jgi:murein L,D-transpeptidase YafK
MRRRVILGALALIGAGGAAGLSAIAPKGPKLAPPPEQIDRILIEKSARRLTVFRGGAALRSYGVALGFAPLGDKQREGDGRTPEGVFRINRRNARSSFHLSLGLDYPLAEDRARAAAGGYDPGGDIFIHGQQTGVTGRRRVSFDWTAGCIAVSNEEIEELWRIVPMGTEVEIRP